MPSSWESVPSAWESIGASALAVPTRRPPASAKPSSALETAGSVVVLSVPCTSARPWEVACTAAFTESERPAIASLAFLMAALFSLRVAIWPSFRFLSSLSADSAEESALRISCLLGVESSRPLIVTHARWMEVVRSAMVLELRAPMWLIAPSSWPWAQPTSPVIWPMS